MLRKTTESASRAAKEDRIPPVPDWSQDDVDGCCLTCMGLLGPEWEPGSMVSEQWERMAATHRPHKDDYQKQCVRNNWEACPYCDPVGYAAFDEARKAVPSDSTAVAPEDTRHPKYPHLENLARYDEVMRVNLVTVTEKLDGANVRFGLTDDGEFWAGSRNLVLDLEDFSASYGFIGWVADEEIASRLLRARQHNRTFYGEWVGRKVQGRIKYPSEGFYLFDVREGTDFLPASQVDNLASILNLRTVPRLYWGKPDLPTLQRLRDKPTAADLTEGIVIKADPPRRDYRGNWIIAKFKSPAFEEVAKAKKRTPRDPKDFAAAQAFVDQYVTLERLRHVFALVREEGADPTDVRETGTVLRAMHGDVIREGLRDYQELDQTQQKAMGGLCARATKPLIEELILAEQQEAA